MVDVEEFRRYLAIDKSKLDDAVIQQPMLLFQVSEALAEANAQRDLAKEELAHMDASLDIEIRKKLEKGMKKSTEAVVAAMVQASTEHQALFNAYIDAKKTAETLFALKDAFVQRGFMLKDLCSLYVANYFEEGSIRSNNTTDRAIYDEKRKLLREARIKRSPLG